MTNAYAAVQLADRVRAVDEPRPHRPHFCPHCGNSLSERRKPFQHEAFDDEAHCVVLADGERRYLQPVREAILRMLRVNFGRIVSKETLLQNCTSRGLTERSPLDVHVCFIRKILAGSPFAIETQWGRGYRLKWADQKPPVSDPSGDWYRLHRNRERAAGPPPALQASHEVSQASP
jgi:DNA-binding response OmpR family regulator